MFTNGYMFLQSFYTLKIAAASETKKNVQPHQSGVKSTLFFILTLRLIRSKAFVGIVSSWIVEYVQHPQNFKYKQPIIIRSKFDH